MIRAGILVADDDDVIQTSRDWQTVQLTRAVRRGATGRGGGPLVGWAHHPAGGGDR
jgi:hypothetical protein